MRASEKSSRGLSDGRSNVAVARHGRWSFASFTDSLRSSVNLGCRAHCKQCHGRQSDTDQLGAQIVSHHTQGLQRYGGPRPLTKMLAVTLSKA
jgi:hypothetical protein